MADTATIAARTFAATAAMNELRDAYVTAVTDRVRARNTADTTLTHLRAVAARNTELVAELAQAKRRLAGLDVIRHDFCERQPFGTDCGECWPCVADHYRNLP